MASKPLALMATSKPTEASEETFEFAKAIDPKPCQAAAGDRNSPDPTRPNNQFSYLFDLRLAYRFTFSYESAIFTMGAADVLSRKTGVIVSVSPCGS